MSKFKVGDRVVSLERMYKEMPGWPNGVVTSLLGGYLYTVKFDGNRENAWAHYPEDMKHAPQQSNHYTPDSSGKDYLARCEETYSRDEMIGAYRFTLGKYVDRMGKKQGEPVEKELDKIIDYATRAKQWLGRQS